MAAKASPRETRERSRARIVEATTELVRERSYAELSVAEIMDRAGIGRTLFYRHFDDLGDLLLRVAREAIGELYDAELALAEVRAGPDPEAIRAAVEAAVTVYERHGPLLRAVSEAAAADPLVREQESELRRRFDLLIEDMIRGGAEESTVPVPDPAESARALNRLQEGYLLDAFGRGPRVSPETAIATLSDIWAAFATYRRSG
jgi:TetR/AcrR family transcriptional regulator, ethionamide resistance regulator